MKYVTTTMFVIFLMSASLLQANEIQLNFPHFSGHTYEWKILQGKDDLLPAIADHMENRPAAQAALSSGVKNMMASVKILTGQKAPDVIFHAPIRTQTGKIDQDIRIEKG